MILPVEKSDHFLKDFDISFEWYAVHAGEGIARRFREALTSTLRLLADSPDMGVKCRFRHPSLQTLRFFLVHPPFDKHLIFYRHDEKRVIAERLMHGARNLSRRLREPPGS